MKKALLSLALALVAANSAFAATAQAGGTAMPVNTYGPWLIAEAYPAEAGSLYETVPCEDNDYIADNNRWSGYGNSNGDPNSNAVGGVLALKEVIVDGSPVLDTAAFATCYGEYEGFVQSYRLIKEIPGSDKCPSTYEYAKYFQFGSGVRTWWTLIYTQPGTTFCLELTVRCLDLYGRPSLHIDKYIWKVVATFESLYAVLDVLHQGAIGTTEVPCIGSEDMFTALVDAVKALEEATGAIETADDKGKARADAQDALFAAEALVITFACFTDCFLSHDVYSASYPPSNHLQFGDYGFTGLIDTLENPCACKILVDLEYIGICYGITSL